MDSVQYLSYDLHFPDEESYFYESDYETRVVPKKKKTVSVDFSVRAAYRTFLGSTNGFTCTMQNS